MKNSNKIILSLAALLLIGLIAIAVCTFSSNGGDGEKNSDALQSDVQEVTVTPLTKIAKSDDGTLYTSTYVEKTTEILDAKKLSIDSEILAVYDNKIYYITNGDDSYAPELRRCDIDGENDEAVTEFISPLGSPAIVGEHLYCAYYGISDDDINAGVFRINLNELDDIQENTIEGHPLTYEKIADGDYYIYGYDSDYIYYASNDGSVGTVLYRMSLSGEDETKVLNYKQRSECIVVDKNYIFFSSYDDINHCYKIYRSPKDGKGNIDEYAFQCMTGYFDVLNSRLYFQADRSIYSAEINGSDENMLTYLDENSLYAYSFLRFDDILYFSEKQSISDKDKVYRLNTSLSEKKCISK